MGVQPYDPPQSRQPSCWEPPPCRASRGYSDYDQPPHLRGMPSRLEIHQQHTYKQPPHYSGVGRYEQLIDLLDAATSRLESQFEEIDRRLTKLQASKAAYRLQPYADMDSRPPRRHPTCWDPPFRTSGRRVGEIRAPPLPEPSPQPVPELFYGPPLSGTSDTPTSKHTTRPSPRPRGFLHEDSAVPPRFPPSAYTGQQREQPQNWIRRTTFPSACTPAVAPPPLLHVD